MLVPKVKYNIDRQNSKSSDVAVPVMNPLEKIKSTSTASYASYGSRDDDDVDIDSIPSPVHLSMACIRKELLGMIDHNFICQMCVFCALCYILYIQIDAYVFN